MTNISKNSFTKSSQGSETWADNLTAIEPASKRSTALADATRSASSSRFAEHLAAPTSKPGAMARPAQPAALKTQDPRAAAPRKDQRTPQAPAAPLPPQKSQMRQPKTEPTQAPWNRMPPATRLVETEQRPVRTMETPARVSASRPETPQNNQVSKPDFNKSQAQTAVTAASQAPNEKSVSASSSQALPSVSMIADTNGSIPAEGTVEGLEDWQLRLQQMLASGNPELFMQQSPALALLAGRLEFVEPAQIPTVVAQSPLLQSILGQAQTADVLQTAMPLEQNLQVLGLMPASPEAKTAGPISLAGMEMIAQQPLITLGETLEALGFDTRRIMQEGDLLKDNLGLEGLQTYMQRAERLRSTLGVPVEWPNIPDAKAMVSSQPLQKPMPQAPLDASTMDPALLAQLSRLNPNMPSSLEAIQLWTQNSENPELMPLTVLDDGKEPIFLNPMENPTETWDPFATAEAPAETVLPTAPTMDEVPLVMNTLPKAPLAAQDPFMAMAQRWNAETLQTLRPEDFVSRERLDLAAESKTAAPQPMRSLQELLNAQFIQGPDSNNRMDASALPLQESASFDVNSLQLSLQDLASSSDNSGGDPSGQSQGQSFMQQDSQSMLGTTQGPAASNKGFGVETAAAPQAASAPVSPQQLQDILDQSTMLIKDGGGSIRLDLGSTEMGPLDLALDIKDKTVELRIVTHSDQAREALVQELPKLRESLQNQNLNLEKVEIGLSYGSAWSQSSGNGQQNREQFFENTSESSSRGPNGIRSTSRSYRQSFVSTPEARVPLHNGLIQVRV